MLSDFNLNHLCIFYSSTTAFCSWWKFSRPTLNYLLSFFQFINVSYSVHFLPPFWKVPTHFSFQFRNHFLWEVFSDHVRLGFLPFLCVLLATWTVLILSSAHLLLKSMHPILVVMLILLSLHPCLFNNIYLVSVIGQPCL